MKCTVYIVLTVVYKEHTVKDFIVSGWSANHDTAVAQMNDIFKKTCVENDINPSSVDVRREEDCVSFSNSNPYKNQNHICSWITIGSADISDNTETLYGVAEICDDREETYASLPRVSENRETAVDDVKNIRDEIIDDKFSIICAEGNNHITTGNDEIWKYENAAGEKYIAELREIPRIYEIK